MIEFKPIPPYNEPLYSSGKIHFSPNSGFNIRLSLKMKYLNFKYSLLNYAISRPNLFPALILTLFPTCLLISVSDL